MALQCLAIIGKVNEPLYLTDVKNSNETGDENDVEDAFGFAASNAQEHLSLRKEVRLLPVAWVRKCHFDPPHSHSISYCSGSS